MPEKHNKLPEISDNYFEGTPYLVTSKDFNTGGSPYLNESQDPSIQANNTGGSPYLDTGEEPSTQDAEGIYRQKSILNVGMEIAGKTVAGHEALSNKIE